MPDYSKSKIYKIWSHLGDDVYYGSTVGTLSCRMAQHRSGFNGSLVHNTKCRKIFEKYGVDNCKIELVELYPCKTVEELRKREGEYIRDNACINNRIPSGKIYIKRAGRTWTEYYNDNKDNYKENYIKNREKRLQYQKEYRAKRDLTPEQKIKKLEEENELLKKEIRLLKESSK